MLKHFISVIALLILIQYPASSAELVNTVTATGEIVDGGPGPFIAAEELGGVLQINVEIANIAEERAALEAAAINNFPPGIPAKIKFRGASKSFVNTNVKIFTIPFNEESGEFGVAEVFVALKDIKRVDRARKRAQSKGRDSIPVKFKTVVKKRKRLGINNRELSNSELNKEAGILPLE